MFSGIALANLAGVPLGTWLGHELGWRATFLAIPVLGVVMIAALATLIGLGVVTGMMTTFFLAAVERIPLGTAVAIEFLGPLMVAGLMSKQRKSLIWPALALVGVVLLTEPWRGHIDLVGVAFAVMAGVCWGLYNGSRSTSATASRASAASRSRFRSRRSPPCRSACRR
ncbi:DMT family transporter [Gulosibacter sp. ACHW.36C]|uniref:Uncharacterized protein n=1 Tax=Gulosibacter sediminis TaxID=1729695 RepID=A0ABY4MUT0_9MICO|nr:hypothetical protein [Gulosibacter sediminis]UQN14181.1 hypothetical protein M3M28_08970 [Gulosibacter sediminis]